MNWIIFNVKKISSHRHPFRFISHLIMAKIIFFLGSNFKFLLPLPLFKYKRNNYYLHYAPNQFSQVLYTYPNIVRHPDDELLLAEYLQPGDNYIDIGANIGTTTLCAASRIHDATHPGIVIAYEAHPHTYKYLLRSILNNRPLLPYIITRNIALGAKSGSIGFTTISNHDDINHVIESEHGMHNNKNIITVPINRLDNESLPEHIDLIKIDVEGYELEVFHGANHVLSRTDAIFFEIYDKNLSTFSHSGRDIIEFLEKMNYKIFKIDIVNKTLQSVSLHGYDGSPECENMLAVRDRDKLLSRINYTII